MKPIIIICIFTTFTALQSTDIRSHLSASHLSARQCSSVQGALVFWHYHFTRTVVTWLRHGGRFNDHFTANLLLSEWKSVNIWTRLCWLTVYNMSRLDQVSVCLWVQFCSHLSWYTEAMVNAMHKSVCHQTVVLYMLTVTCNKLLLIYETKAQATETYDVPTHVKPLVLKCIERVK